ncbi:MAG: hypothetical protein AMXMBFR44_5800 [Candidatus Campbellbacteria bacterium]
METQLEKPKMTPKDFFLYLGVAVSLYASAGALLALLFSIINIALPDPLNPYYAATWASSGMRFAISTLLVAFPVYLAISWLIRKDIAGNVAKYQLSVRKWFIYFTLFIAGAAIAGDLIALVNTYLNGEISARFIWKMFAVFGVAGVIFAYYFYDIKRAAAGNTKTNTTLIIVAAAGVLAAVIAGFSVAGSPGEIRELRFDELRIADLQSIQWQVTEYYQRHKTLPADLGALQDDISGYRAPVDPKTGEAYEYAVKSQQTLTFELCATFGASTIDATSSYAEPSGETFRHEAGRVCFTRTIDPLAYPILKQ